MYTVGVLCLQYLIVMWYVIGHVPGRPSFSITVDNSDAPGTSGRTVGGKMRRNRKTDRATPYKPSHTGRNKVILNIFYFSYLIFSINTTSLTGYLMNN